MLLQKLFVQLQNGPALVFIGQDGLERHGRELALLHRLQKQLQPLVGEVGEDEKLTGEILPVIKGLEAAKIASQRADGIEILPFFHYADLRAQPHGGHAELGKLLGIHAHDRIFFTSGATESLNTVLCGLDYGEEGRGILATQTEHNSVLRPLMNQPVFKKHPVTIISCLENGAVTRKALEKGLEEALENTGKNPSALIVNHCSNVTGYVQDMKLIGNFVRENNLLLLVDVSQSAGCIPVDADSWRADGVIFTGHKSLLGIQGTGGFFIRKGLELKPLKYGGTGRNSQQLTYEDGDYEYEVGTQNLPGIRALLAGVEFVLETGVDRIQEKEERMMKLLYEGLGKIPGVQIYGSFAECKGPVMSLNFQGLKASDVAYILENGYEITVRAGLHCSPLIHEAMGTKNSGTVRVSVSWFTKEEEILAFLEAAGQIAASLRGAD